MKITAEIEINWLDEEGVVDEEVQTKLLNAVSKMIMDKFNGEIASGISDAAHKLVTAKTEQLIYTALEKPITITEGWNKATKYESVYDMIETNMTKLYQGKFSSQDGKCNVDPFLATLQKYIKTEVDRLLAGTEKIIKDRAVAAAKEELSKSELLKAINVSIT